jgi:hypothetical protein
VKFVKITSNGNAILELRVAGVSWDALCDRHGNQARALGALRQELERTVRAAIVAPPYAVGAPSERSEDCAPTAAEGSQGHAEETPASVAP